MTLYKPLLLTGCCFLIALCLIFYRSLSVEKSGTSDLRNRIVGARLQKDGISPYFYIWQNGDSIRYYDASNLADPGVSNITASPFFHNLLYPIAEFRQRTISHIWFALEYLFILLTVLLAYLSARNNLQKIAVLTAFTLFLFTEAWKNHIAVGQIYILVSLLPMIIYYCLTKPERLFAAFMAGLASIVLVLIRPNMAIFFFPFLLLAGNYSRKYLVVFIIPVIMLPAVHFAFENNRTYWKDYAKAIQASIKVHQSDPFGEKKLVLPEAKSLRKYEGWDMDEVARHEKATNFVLHSENGNVYIVFKHLFKRQLPLVILNFLSILSIVVCVVLFFSVRKKYDIITLPNIALFGYCLFMIVELFSPVCRHQYYGIEWLFPLLLAASVYKPANKWLYAGLLLGLVLNVINTDLIKMEHTIGEYILLPLLLWLSLTRKLTQSKN